MINNGKVIFNTKLNDTIYYLRIKVPISFKVQPGQFINIKVSDDYVPLLRRPFSVFNYEKGFIDILYKVIGDGTKKLSQKKKEDILDFIGPVGNSYVDFFSEDESKEKNIYLVAGGTGFASIHFFAKWLLNKKIKFKLFYGAKNKKEIFQRFCKNFDMVIATDDGSLGNKGMITSFIKGNRETIIFCCGPQSMLKTIQSIRAYKKFASFESYMGCANGVCLSCVIKIKNGKDFDYVRVCKEGTVFDLDDVIII
ncbi:MAG: dihydroorotate dehydrogenase electron transfer subunit [Candidatus Goldbacteria bacterium]|nr:dihydroorotate dehydrogenase electron transfer subunit [Candidatus Goldiibacteriota bacterium]